MSTIHIKAIYKESAVSSYPAERETAKMENKQPLRLVLGYYTQCLVSLRLRLQCRKCSA